MLLRSIFALLVVVSSIACTRTTIFSQAASGVDQHGEAGSSASCDDILQHLREAKQIISELSRFKWTELAAVGVVLPPPRVCATGTTYLAERNSVPEGLGWMPLTEKLSFFATAENFAVACNNSLSLAKRMCSSGTKLSLTERQELFNQLSSSLIGAAYLVLSHKSVVLYQVIPEIESEFKRSNEAIKQKYGGRFKTRCDEYLALLDSLQYHIEMAKQLISTLSGEQDAVHR